MRRLREREKKRETRERRVEQWSLFRFASSPRPNPACSSPLTQHPAAATTDMRSPRVFFDVVLVLPALLTALAASFVPAAAAANVDSTTTAKEPPPLALNASPPTRRLKIDTELAIPTATNDTEDAGDARKRSGGGGSSSSSSSSSSSPNSSVSSCSRVRRRGFRGGGFLCSDGSNEVVGPMGAKGG